MIQVGQVVGNYHVVRPIGEGGMGAVFEAVHQYIGHRAAIKILYPEYSKNPLFVTRFMNEARAVKLVQHPGLVEVSEFGFLPDGTAYIVMEYLDGESLTKRISRKGTRWARNDLGLLRQIAQALQAAHDRGIIHRDLKPDNVIIVADPERPSKERAKILDFGIAKLAEEHLGPASARFKTQTGMVIGTPHYMSPEQCGVGGSLDGKVDVYALGVIVYEMLTGQLPFDADLPAAILVMHVYDQPRPIQELDPSIPTGLATLVHTMLAKRPADRPTMGQLAEQLTLLLDSPEISAVEGDQTAIIDSQLYNEAVGPSSHPPTLVTDSSGAMPTQPAPAIRLRRTTLVLLVGSAGLSALLLVSGMKLRGGTTVRERTVAVKGAGAPDAGTKRAPPAVASCAVSTTPTSAKVLRASDGVLLGETPWHMEQPVGRGSLDILLRRDKFTEQRLTLDFGADCTKQVTLLALPPPRPKIKNPSPSQPPRTHPPEGQGQKHGPSIEIPIVHVQSH